MKSADGTRIRPWLPFLLIIAAAALAHLWCLGSQFYMDDMNQIRDSELVRTGNLLPINRSSWTQLFYVIQYRLFGMSPVAFHAVNWLLHTAVACTLFGFGYSVMDWPAFAFAMSRQISTKIESVAEPVQPLPSV